jgi:hypothetical protein
MNCVDYDKLLSHECYSAITDWNSFLEEGVWVMDMIRRSAGIYVPSSWKMYIHICKDTDV